MGIFTLYWPGSNTKAFRWEPNWLFCWVLKTLLIWFCMVAVDIDVLKMSTLGPKSGGVGLLSTTPQMNVSQPAAVVRSATNGAFVPRFRSAETKRPVPTDCRLICPPVSSIHLNFSHEPMAVRFAASGALAPRFWSADTKRLLATD